VICLD